MRRYKDDITSLDMLVNFDGHEYRVVRIWSKKEHKAVFLITNIKQIRFRICSEETIQTPLAGRAVVQKNLRGVNAKEEKIVLAMLLVSMIADMLKILIVRVLDAKYKMRDHSTESAFTLRDGLLSLYIICCLVICKN